jgi:hypothetical protein
VSTGQENRAMVGNEAAFETRDLYLACFLRCTGYDLIALRPEGRRKVFVFRDGPPRRRAGVLPPGCGGSAAGVLRNHQGHEGAAAQCMRNLSVPVRSRPADRNSRRRSKGSARSCSTDCATVTSDAPSPAPSAKATDAISWSRLASRTSSLSPWKNYCANPALKPAIPAMGTP